MTEPAGVEAAAEATARRALQIQVQAFQIKTSQGQIKALQV
jgi:DNA-directed RNA polymerase subunit K/omega